MLTRRHRTALDFTIFTAPSLALILATSLVPFAMNINYALTSWNGISNRIKFVGVSNFVELFTNDRDFLAAGVFTLLFTLASVLILNVLAMALAVVLDKQLATRKVLRAAYFLPNALSLVIAGFIWRFILTKGFDGLFALTGWAAFKTSLIGDPHLAFWAVLIVSVWQSLGFYMVIYLAGLQVVPRELLEASTIDGISGARRFFMITLPLIMPSVSLSVFYSLASSLKQFDIVFTLTNGGPGGSTATLAFNIYREAFVSGRFGYGVAKCLVFFVVVFGISRAQTAFFKSREVEL
jgi:raffinose/stachyose/melibiose transport system permease protein